MHYGCIGQRRVMGRESQGGLMRTMGKVKESGREWKGVKEEKGKGRKNPENTRNKTSHHHH